MKKTNPKLKEALLDLFSTILDCNEEDRAMFWLDYSGHVSNICVRSAEGHYNTLAQNLGLHSIYLNVDDENVEDILTDIAEKKLLVLSIASEWTDEKMKAREEENKKHRLEQLKKEIAKLEE